MKFTIPLAALLTGASAFPFLAQNMDSVSPKLLEQLDPAAVKAAMDQTEAFYQRMEQRRLERRAGSGGGGSIADGNCGATPCTTFNEKEQFVSQSGEHAYAAPAVDEIRGPCPGLNAAANHAYLPRSGIATIAQTIDGLGQMFGMSVDLAGFLAAYAIVLDGDYITQTWSIGGPQPSTTLGSGLLSKPQGISWSHNKYEGDTSIARNDAYMAGGDAHSLNITKFRTAYETCTGGLCTLEGFRKAHLTEIDQAIAENPYYFAPAFSTTLVVPAAYNFVLAFMSNHSAQEPGGYLTQKDFKTWFAIEGDYPNFKWKRGQERMPARWYRRPSAQQYSIPSVLEDLVKSFVEYPRSFRLGGNVNGVNSYVGVNPFDVTGGQYNYDDLFTTKNFGCFVFQTQQQAVPDQLKGLVSSLAPVLDFLDKYTAPVIGSLRCPALEKYDSSPFNKFPGRTYSPTGPATNY